MKQNLIDTMSVGGFLLMVAGILLVYINHGLFSFSPIVIAVQALALLLMVWARMTFGGRSFHFSASPTEGGLVTTGPYRYIRHPIYSAVLIFTWAGLLANVSVRNLLFGLITFAGAYVRMQSEETLVRIKYPEYDEYAKKTWRLIPYFF